MGTFIWRSLATIVPLITLFTCNLTGASSTKLKSSTSQDEVLGLDVCKLVYCGKGTCNVANNTMFGFRCDCDSGWKKLNVQLPLLGNGTVEFPPCIIPNCTFDSRCGNGLSIPKLKFPDLPIDFNNPCLFSVCGDDGTCVKDEANGFRCQCNEGYANLLHDPKMTCIKKCAFGVGCSGLDLLPSPETPPPPPPQNSSSPPTGLGEMLNWSRGFYLLSTMMFAAIIFSNGI